METAFFFTKTDTNQIDPERLASFITLKDITVPQSIAELSPLYMTLAAAFYAFGWGFITYKIRRFRKLAYAAALVGAYWAWVFQLGIVLAVVESDKLLAPQ